jgi:hypothetical protein
MLWTFRMHKILFPELLQNVYKLDATFLFFGAY